jgi:hypothetical protein
MGPELFLRFPKEKSSSVTEGEKWRDREREREKKGWPERSTIARPWWEGFPGEQSPSEGWTVMIMFLGSLSQFGTTYTNLGSEEMSLHGCQI